MAKHTLSLQVTDTLNISVLRILDLSVYNPMVKPEFPLLEVTMPGFSQAVEFGEGFIKEGFSINLTACNLQVQTENCGTSYLGLPDGIYTIKYSVSPNDVVFVEYNHLRVSKLMNKYQQVLCALEVNSNAPSKELAKKLETLREIRMYIDAAKAKVEICHEAKKGMELYTYAEKILSTFDCTSC